VLVGRADPERLVLPDGSTRVTAAMPTGDLEAVRRASGASSAVAASPLAGEAMACTNAVTTAVTLCLANNEGRPGAYTPGALFGPVLAVEAGGWFVVGR
jgi:hypothetical protein